MVKMVGILLIISVCTVFGQRAAAGLKMRKRKLREFCLFIGETEDMMRLGTELERIYKTQRARSLLWVSGYSVDIIDEGLLAEDKVLLKEFFSRLGMGDLSSGLALCDAYKQILSKRAAEAEKAADEKSRLYSLLGLFSGIFIAILLV